MSSETPYLQVDANDVPPTLMLFLVLVLTALGTTGPRRQQPTLLGFIHRVELELKTVTPRPQPRPVPPLIAKHA
jgi:hypothetical protein